MKPASPDPAASPAQPNVLIIDDDRGFCALIRDYLLGFGYVVAAAHTGPAGVERATDEGPCRPSSWT